MCRQIKIQAVAFGSPTPTRRASRGSSGRAAKIAATTSTGRATACGCRPKPSAVRSHICRHGCWLCQRQRARRTSVLDERRASGLRPSRHQRRRRRRVRLVEEAVRQHERCCGACWTRRRRAARLRRRHVGCPVPRANNSRDTHLHYDRRGRQMRCAVRSSIGSVTPAGRSTFVRPHTPTRSASISRASRSRTARRAAAWSSATCSAC